MKTLLTPTLCARACLIFIAAASVFGCSTYSGKKIGDATGQLLPPDGVPYSLVRPEYTLTRTPPAAGAKTPTYEIKVTYVPDPTQRYSVKVDPGIFANPEFALKFGDGGALVGTTGTFTEQITPTITALGSFAANLLGPLAVVLDKDSIRNQIKLVLTGDTCTEQSDVPRIPSEAQKFPTVKDELIRRIGGYKDDAEFADQFHYVTEKERACLAVAHSALDNKVSTAAKVKIDEWTKAQKDYLATHPDESSFVDRLTAAVSTEDTKELAAIKKTIADDTDTARGNRRDALFVTADAAASAFSATAALPKLKFFVDMDSKTWRARHILYLEREITRIGLLRIREPQLAGDSAISRHLLSLREQRASTLDATDLFARSLILARFLDTIRDKPVLGGRAPATAEFATARAELDATLAQIDARRAQILADAAPPPPPPVVPLQDKPVTRVSQKVIDDSKATGWSTGAGANAPDYVLVLEEVK